MQLSPYVSHPPVATTSSLYNLAVLSSSPADDNGVFVVESDIVPFDNEPNSAGMHTRTTYMWDKAVIQGEMYRATSAEATARHALADAIEGSGLLTMLTPTDDGSKPAPGLTRIFLDRRSRVIEFETAHAPAAAQAVLDALAAYRAIAERRG